MVTFEQCVKECVVNKEFMSNYKRLRGVKLSLLTPCNPITAMVDEATGFGQKEANDLFDFIHDYINLPLVMTDVTPNI